MPTGPDGAISISTYGDLVDRQHCMIAYCSGCSRSADIDLAAIVAAGRGGESYLGRQLRCTACGQLGSPIIMAEAARVGRAP